MTQTRRKRLCTCMNVLGVALCLCLYVSAGFLHWWCAASLCYQFAVLILLLREPKLAMHNNQKRTSLRSQLDMVPLLLSLFTLIASFSRFSYTDQAFWYLMGASLLAIAALLLILWFAGLRRTDRFKGRRVWVVMLAVFLAINLAGCTNAVFNPETPRLLSGTVEQTYVRRNRRGGSKYRAKVIVDGETYTFRISRARRDSLSPGDPVTVAFYEGLLGIPYQRLP